MRVDLKSGSDGFVADFLHNDFAERCILGRKLFEGLHQRAVAALKLFDAKGNQIDQHIRIGNLCSGLFDVIVSHGEGLNQDRIR